MCRREVMDDFLRKRAEGLGAKLVNGLLLRMEQKGINPQGLALLAAIIAYLSATPGVLTGALDYYVLAPLQVCEWVGGWCRQRSVAQACGPAITTRSTWRLLGTLLLHPTPPHTPAPRTPPRSRPPWLARRRSA